MIRTDSGTCRTVGQLLLRDAGHPLEVVVAGVTEVRRAEAEEDRHRAAVPALILQEVCAVLGTHLGRKCRTRLLKREEDTEVRARNTKQSGNRLGFEPWRPPQAVKPSPCPPELWRHQNMPRRSARWDRSHPPGRPPRRIVPLPQSRPAVRGQVGVKTIQHWSRVCMRKGPYFI